MKSLNEVKRISSVGIDVGTSTSHLVFSELVLKKDPTSRTEKYHVAERKIIYKGEIFFTPIKENKIDIEELSSILLKEYLKAGIKATEVDTGAVIITGESARRENAEKLIKILANESGNFVAASAGPNFESVISAYGSGAISYSLINKIRIIHTDIGGGTSNIAIIDNGKITHTACINVGGRLLIFSSNNIIIRLEPAGTWTLEECGFDLSLNSLISEDQKEILALKLAESLIEVITGQELSDYTQKLMMTPNLPNEIFTSDYLLSFSGGIAEYIYNITEKNFGDLGSYLGRIMKRILYNRQIPFIEAPEKIRATVIGASEYTLQVSGSTTFMSTEVDEKLLPLKNIPIIVPNITSEMLKIETISQEIRKALQRLDLSEGTDLFVLAFDDPVRTVYDKLTIFTKGIVKALPQTIQDKDKPIILVFNTDIGNSVGNVMKRETGIQNKILSIDEISLSEGTFIDIGKPIVNNRVFPVVVKSLIFG